MSSIRILKKEINNFASELKNEIQDYLKFHPEFSREDAVKLALEIEELRIEAMHNLNEQKNKQSEKSKKLFSEILEKAKSDLLKTMDKLGAKK